MMQHQKHSTLAKPTLGQFGRREWAILGTPCGPIRQLAQDLIRYLSDRFEVAYVDADHQAAEAEPEGLDFALEYTDKIRFQRIDRAEKPNAWQQRAHFNAADLVLVNGNHFAAARQIVVLDRRKFDSLQRKAERLTQVDLFLTHPVNGETLRPEDLPESLKQHVPGWANIQVLDLHDVPAIAAFLSERLTAPPLRALILGGGKSTRMGQDKTAIDYHGMPQWMYVRQLLHTAGVADVFISCRAEQAATFAPQSVISDSFLDLGPMGAILSAFRAFPDAAWLVLACDLPLLDVDTLRFLLEQRRPSAPATAFRQPPAAPGWGNGADTKGTGFPEPLVAIWEPKSYPVLLQFLAQGVSCPRKVLINSNTHLLDAPAPEALLNVNTPEERERLRPLLQRV